MSTRCIHDTAIVERESTNFSTTSPIKLPADVEREVFRLIEQDNFSAAIEIVTESSCHPVTIGPDNRTLLHCACNARDVSAVNKLINELNYNPMATDDEGMTPLHVAASIGQAHIVTFLSGLEGVNLNCRDQVSKTPLHHACKNGHLDVVKILVIELNCQSTVSDSNGYTPLHLAAYCGYTNIVRLLIIEVRLDPMCVTTQGRTPLHLACKKGYLDVAKILVNELNCQPVVADKGGATPLHLAAHNGHTSIVRFLTMEKGVDPKCVSTLVKTPLHLACEEGHLGVAKVLVNELNVQPVVTDKNGATPFHWAAGIGHTAIVRFLTMEKGVDPTCMDKQRRTPLHWACLRGHLDIVKLLVNELDCQPVMKDKLGANPLHWAAMKGHIDTVRFLTVEKRVDPTCVDNGGVTPLHWASIEGHLDVAKHLVNELNCQPTIEDKEGATPLHYAAYNGHIAIVRFLTIEKRGAPMCMLRTLGRTPLHFACENGHLDVTKVLVNELNCQPVVLDKEGFTPLHLAAGNGHTTIVRFLTMEKGVDLTCVNAFGRTPLHYACHEGHLDVAKVLVNELNSHPVVADMNGNTPLHLAAQNGHTAIVRFLIVEKGVNPTCLNKLRRTPLHDACEKGHLDVTKVLVSDLNCHTLVEDTCTNHQNTPLHLAAKNGCAEIVSFLIMDKGVDPTLVDSSWRTPLWYVHKLGRVDLLKHLLHFCLTKAVSPSKTGLGRFILPKYFGFLHPKCYSQLSPIPRLYIIGNPATGKSSLAAALQEENRWILGYFIRITVPPNTKGISVSKSSSQYYGSTIIYDFAGQAEYYASHSAIIENASSYSKPIFIIVVNLQQSDIQNEVKYWCSFILAACKERHPNPSVILVGSHLDVLLDSQMASLLSDSEMASLEVLSGCGANICESLNFAGIVTLDCTRSESAGISSLRQILTRVCRKALTGIKLTTLHSVLLAFIKFHFVGATILRILTLLDRLLEENAPTTHDPNEVYSLCEDLSSAGHIVLMKDRSDKWKSWIILDQAPILHEVHGFQKSRELQDTPGNKTGIVPLSKLKKYLRGRFDSVVICQYLIHLEFCQEISDPQILNTIRSAPKPDTEPEQYLFFPDLIAAETPEGVWVEDEQYTHYFGWSLQCKKDSPCCFLPRFVQVLLLRVASAFALVAPVELPHKPHPTLKPECVIWKNGIRWISTAHASETLVEVVSTGTTVNVHCRCREEEKMNLYKYRSAVIMNILKVVDDISPTVETDEFVIAPKNLKKYPLEPNDAQTRFLIPIIAQQICKHEKYVVSHQSVPQLVAAKVVKINELLGCEPFCSLKRSMIQKLFSKETKDVTICDSFITGFADVVDAKWEEIAYVLNFSPAEVDRIRELSQSNPAKCVRVLQEYKASGGTYGELCQKFGEYSVLCGRNPLKFAPEMTVSDTPLPATERNEDAEVIPEAAKPTMIEMVRFRGTTRRINIPSEIGIKYKRFGILLLEDGNGTRIEAIAHQHRDNAEMINMDVLQKWIDGRGRLPVTWATLIEVLYDIDLHTLASDIKEVKIVHHTPPPTQQ